MDPIASATPSSRMTMQRITSLEPSIRNVWIPSLWSGMTHPAADRLRLIAHRSMDPIGRLAAPSRMTMQRITSLEPSIRNVWIPSLWSGMTHPAADRLRLIAHRSMDPIASATPSSRMTMLSLFRLSSIVYRLIHTLS